MPLLLYNSGVFSRFQAEKLIQVTGYRKFTQSLKTFFLWLQRLIKSQRGPCVISQIGHVQCWVISIEPLN